MTLISSTANPRVSKLQRLHTTRGRKKSGQCLLEGPHLLLALLDAGMVPLEVYYQPEVMQRQAETRLLLERVKNAELGEQQLFEVSERVMEAISDVQTSQGIVCVMDLAAFEAAAVTRRRAPASRPALLILDDLADPGNMGTIMRTALAADVERVLLTPNCVDCFNSKVIRSAAGAHLFLPVESNINWDEIQERVRAHCQERVLMAEAHSPNVYFDLDLVAPFALIIGNEAHGPSQSARALATIPVAIPQAAGIESLNAAMAAGILLYEAVRQRSVARR
ncbi:TrmH family RNA methyltransferase [Ktedonobacter racemifer]|uniref:tRNA/rRNA methyltransferase (SpoU) n=1 Tax=Ktedonobacter racemifer DSM 44963 TaxID=485913 RepID=D6TH97_KTERA|nr:RNA methyltransferase [Ktedonobacter racemifer]EFH90839.1 tRNA/rRNA methyltransferase (SpoU) [Ktedonobacter racemifer DSM 44963]